MLGSGAREGEAGIVRHRGGLYYVSPGASLHGAGLKKGQCSLMTLLQRSVSAEVDSWLLAENPLMVSCIKASNSIAVTNKKTRARYAQIVENRRDMNIPEFGKEIMEYIEDFPGLYASDDPVHFSEPLARSAFVRIVEDAVAEALSRPHGKNCVVVIVCAGWNAEPAAKSSMKEAFILREMTQCRTTRDLMVLASKVTGVSCAIEENIAHHVIPPVIHQTYCKESTAALTRMTQYSDFHRVHG